MPRYVIICGGRDHPQFTQGQRDWLSTLHAASCFVEVVTGGATGADEEGRDWARTKGIDVVTFWANWTRDGRSAGPRRNARMLAYIIKQARVRVSEACVIAFPGGAGTNDMIRQARAKDVAVLESHY